jgi:hypothetical protein
MKAVYKTKYYVVAKGMAYWQPSRAMRDNGAKNTPLGPDSSLARDKADLLTQQYKIRNLKLAFQKTKQALSARS